MATPPAAQVGEHRLAVAQEAAAGRGIARVADGGAARQARGQVAPEKASATWPRWRSVWKRLAVEDGDAAGLLAAMLQGVQAQRRRGRRRRRRRTRRTRRTPGAACRRAGPVRRRVVGRAHRHLLHQYVQISPLPRCSLPCGIGHRARRSAPAARDRGQVCARPDARPPGASAAQQRARRLRPADRGVEPAIQAGARSGGRGGVEQQVEHAEHHQAAGEADGRAQRSVQAPRSPACCTPRIERAEASRRSDIDEEKAGDHRRPLGQPAACEDAGGRGAR